MITGVTGKAALLLVLHGQQPFHGSLCAQSLLGLQQPQRGHHPKGVAGVGFFARPPIEASTCQLSLQQPEDYEKGNGERENEDGRGLTKMVQGQCTSLLGLLELVESVQEGQGGQTAKGLASVRLGARPDAKAAVTVAAAQQVGDTGLLPRWLQGL